MHCWCEQRCRCRYSAQLVSCHERQGNPSLITSGAVCYKLTPRIRRLLLVEGRQSTVE